MNEINTLQLMGAMKPAVREREGEGGCVSVGGGVRREETAA